MKLIFKIFWLVLIIIIGCALILIVSNPNKDEFIQWATVEMKGELELGYERVLGGVLIEATIDQSTDRQDLLFLSVYTS